MIIAALETQKEIFGDELFGSVRKTSITSAPRKSAPKQKASPPLEKPVEVTFPVSVHEPVPVVQTASAAAITACTDLDQLRTASAGCMRCRLGETRKNIVFGEGNPSAHIMVIGEGPGADEDASGSPFVGRAGQLLTKILAAIQFPREEVYIANIVKCRPPGNRVPQQDEMQECMHYLHKQIELINPKFILCLGTTAGNALLGKKDTLGAMRGKVFDVKGTRAMVTYHPSALLRNPNWKKDCWEDVQQFRKMYDDWLTAK